LEDGAGHERSALHVTRRYATANWRPGEISADHNSFGAMAHHGNDRHFAASYASRAIRRFIHPQEGPMARDAFLHLESGVLQIRIPRHQGAGIKFGRPPDLPAR
jgi:hypothetical protein